MSRAQYIRTRGFTIVELLIVIVIIGILAALVLATFGGLQARARDSERQTDAVTFAKVLRTFRASSEYYPYINRFTNDNTFSSHVDWTTQNLPELQNAVMIAPGSSAVRSSITNTISPTVSQYGYRSFGPDGTTQCTTGSGLVETDCKSAVMYYRTEADNVVRSIALP